MQFHSFINYDKSIDYAPYNYHLSIYNKAHKSDSEIMVARTMAINRGANSIEIQLNVLKFED